ncbi:hypothetical protein ACE103_08960 [Bradyrhizobium sp. ma5]|uniref:hypothetical protein n=1 Tax=Bradyrhizobium sp. ma5 TaxID=3344828 RepID=UPI0035D445C9
MLVDEQLALELGGLEADATLPAPANDVAVAKPSGNRAKRRAATSGRFQSTYRAVQVLEPDATACPCCRGQLHKFGEDVSRCCRASSRAAWPSTALVSHVVLWKFAWYLPLCRQVQILAG